MMNLSTTFPIEMPGARHRTDGAAEALLQGAALVAALALTAHARVYLPLSPVPVTLQTFVVLLAGPLLGWRKASAAVLAYLLLGLAGAPFFTASAGITAGYLAAFLAAPWVVTRFDRPVVGMAAATGLIYLLGAGWLMTALGLSPVQAIAGGVLPFVAGDVVKLAGAAALARGFARRA